ncbi:MAG: tetratricopeptide repeat protein [Brevinema sp.]
MPEIVWYIVATLIVLIIVLSCIYFIVIVPTRETHLKELLATSQFSDAEIFLQNILRKEPHNLKIAFKLAELYWETEDYHQAINTYEHLLTKKLPYSIRQTVLFRMANWYKRQKQYPYAKERITELLDSDPHNFDYLCLLADIYFETQYYHESITLYKKALSINKHNLHCWKRLGNSYFYQRQYTDAYKAFAYAVNIDPKDPELWYQSAETCRLSNDHDKALSFYIRTEQFPQSQYSLLAILKIAEIYRNKNSQQLYTQYLEKAQTIIQHNIDKNLDQNTILDVYYQLGECYLNNNHLELALKEWEQILKIDPGYKNTSELFNSYSTSRIHDFFKDLLTTQGEDLTDILLEFVKSLGYTIDSIQHFGEYAINIYASENSSKWRDIRRRKTIIAFWCSTDPIPNDIILRLSSTKNTHDISQIYIISAGPILSEMRQLLSKKSIDVFDQTNIKELINVRKKIQQL